MIVVVQDLEFAFFSMQEGLRQSQEALISAKDYALTVNIFEPELDVPRGVVFIVPAMGVPQRYYAKLVMWLVQQGCYYFLPMMIFYGGTQH